MNPKMWRLTLRDNKPVFTKVEIIFHDLFIDLFFSHSSHCAIIVDIKVSSAIITVQKCCFHTGNKNSLAPIIHQA